MSVRETSVPIDYFEDLYARNADPWEFATSDYELNKYATSIAALPRARYDTAFEVGCSIGVLTEMIAARCGALFAIEPVTAALEQAKARCAALPHVTFAQMTVPADWPEGQFDLIVLSEVIYYLGQDDLLATAAKVEASMKPGSDLLVVHWTGTDVAPREADDATERLMRALGDAVQHLRHDSHVNFRVDVLRHL